MSEASKRDGASSAKRKPDWTLCVKEGERWREVGAAWNTDRGNVFVVLKEAMRPGTAMLFPFREKPAQPLPYRRPTMRPAPTKRAYDPASEPDYMDHQRQERRSPPPPPPPPSDDCPDPEAPEWLDK